MRVIVRWFAHEGVFMIDRGGASTAHRVTDPAEVMPLAKQLADGKHQIYVTKQAQHVLQVRGGLVDEK